MRKNVKNLWFYTDLTEYRLPILHSFFILRLYVKQTSKLPFIKRRMMNMKKFTCLGLSMVLTFGLLAGCGSSNSGSSASDPQGSAPAQQETAELSGTITANGSSTGIEAAKNGTADIGLASRALKDEETAAGLKGTNVALDGIAVIVNAGSKVEDLTVEQIAQVFTGEIADWSELGGDAGTIACVGREGGSGTRDGFESITGTEDACVLSQELTSTGAVIEAVKNNPQAIGYASLSAVEGKEGIKAITVGGVPCTEETVLDGSYQIQRPFVMVTRESETLSPAAQAFFDWAVSADASDLIRQAGAVPLA